VGARNHLYHRYLTGDDPKRSADLHSQSCHGPFTVDWPLLERIAHEERVRFRRSRARPARKKTVKEP